MKRKTGRVQVRLLALVVPGRRDPRLVLGCSRGNPFVDSRIYVEVGVGKQTELLMENFGREVFSGVLTSGFRAAAILLALAALPAFGVAGPCFQGRRAHPS